VCFKIRTALDVFDAAAGLALFDIVDPISAEDIHQQILRNHLTDIRQSDLYNAKKNKDLPLSYLRNLYEQDHAVRAAQLLLHKHTIVIDDDFKVPLREANLSLPSQFLDFTLAVPQSSGLDMLLPNSTSSLNYNFPLNLRNPLKEFSNKHGLLGFDPTGAMLYIGNCPNGEEAFLAWAPDAWIKGEIPNLPASPTKVSTRLQTSRYRTAVAFMAWCLSCVIGLGLDCPDYGYGVTPLGTKPNFEALGNVMLVFLLIS
jgi:hypothetical protein